MVVDTQHLIELAVMGLLNIGATFGAIRARLNALEKRDDATDRELERAHARIDTLYTFHK